MAVPPSAVLVGSGIDRPGRPVLRRLSGQAGGAARSDSRVEVGTMTLYEFRSSAAMALATVREHKARSLLTVLGVIIGTGAVIAVGSIITGVNGAITDMATAVRARDHLFVPVQPGIPRRSEGRGNEAQEVHLGDGARAGRALPFGGTRVALSLQPEYVRPRRMGGPGEVREPRHLQHRARGHRGRLRRGRGAESALGPLLHRRGKPPPSARGGDRRTCLQGAVSGRRSGRQVDRGGGPSAPGGGRDRQRRRVSRPGGPARPAALFHHAQDLPDRR